MPCRLVSFLSLSVSLSLTVDLSEHQVHGSDDSDGIRQEAASGSFVSPHVQAITQRHAPTYWCRIIKSDPAK
jgi:hypothetical protein